MDRKSQIPPVVEFQTYEFARRAVALKKLTLSRVAWALLRFADRDGRCWPSNRTLADILGHSYTGAVRRALAELEQLGLIERVELGPGKRGFRLIGGAPVPEQGGAPVPEQGGASVPEYQNYPENYPVNDEGKSIVASSLPIPEIPDDDELPPDARPGTIPEHPREVDLAGLLGPRALIDITFDSASGEMRFRRHQLTGCRPDLLHVGEPVVVEQIVGFTMAEQVIGILQDRRRPIPHHGIAQTGL
ncbi:MAG TPA: helix-turn-helix domain-containing protein [Actinomycetota bacterium]|nr:helix-turn-helix domain-containing protein [Actinomycetota bacterium]